MCGIAGIWTRNIFSGKELAEICLQFSGNLSHRGPDDEGFVLFTENGDAEIFGGDHSNAALQLKHISKAEGRYKGALVHRRLSIISPGPEGHQPMRSEDGKSWIVYNGETFNYKQLDAQFGIQNRSNNDSETVLELASRKISGGHELLDGFHAFAIYNVTEGKLNLYRDRTGVKPLYYAFSDGNFAFASETKTLRKWTGFREVNQEAVFHLLAEGIIIPGMELLNGIEEVDYEMEISLTDFSVRKKFFVHDERKPEIELESAVYSAVESRLMADVPLGFAVSGGLDSAIVIGVAKHIAGDNSRLKLFSIISDDPHTDESYWQNEIAKAWNGEWHKKSTADFGPELLEKVVASTELPPVAWNNLAQYELADLAKEGGVTVFLNGQGADEIFGGYPDYVIRYFAENPGKMFKGRNNFPMGRLEIIKGIAKLWAKRKSSATRLQNMFWKKQDGWLHAGMQTFSSYNWSLSKLKADEIMREDFYGQRLRQMLRWEDLNGMAHQLESRNPFADNAVLTQWLNVPLKEKMITGYTKEILRWAMDDYVPVLITERRDKKGFSVPDAKLTWKHKEAWKDAFFSTNLNAFSPMKKREFAWKNVRQTDEKDLRWIFRLSALSFYLENLKS